ncbi:MAG: hypothetical protein KatS3mg124_0647 [Porticoccaceae bacterium]|nr:MAG: hypothetical protein KatS3mg124_0647 [Porticoccaceae bacterium]
MAAVVPKSGARLSAAELSAALRERLASYKVPRAFVFAAEEEIPRTDTGKVKLDALADFIARRLAEGKPSS